MLEAKNLSKYYGNFKVLDNLNFRVEPGDVYGFLGNNGSGKSTSLKILLNLIKADAGHFAFAGKPIRFGDYKYLANIGALIERPDFYEHLSAKKNLEILSKYYTQKITASRIEEVLELVGLSARSQDKVANFSMGMKQRLGIAQSVMHHPELLLLDEPSNGLDPKAQIDMLKLIKTLNQELKTTVVFSTHLLHEVQEVANRMLIIDGGKNISEGLVSDFTKTVSIHYHLWVSNGPLGITLLAGHPATVLSEQEIQFSAKADELPHLIKNLVEGGVEIKKVESSNSLTEYFFSNVC